MRWYLVFLVWPLWSANSCWSDEGVEASKIPVVIAHRGASGYCVEHTEAAKTLAHAQQADYIEQDVVLTRDSIFIVSHDITMEAITDVALVYPDRARSDGKFYWIDFTWEELQRVSLCPRGTNQKPAEEAASRRVPLHRVVRLEEEILLLRSLDQAFSRQTGLYIELKAPGFHRKETGNSMGELLLASLQKLEVPTDPKHCLIQCFESEELVDLKDRLQSPYALIQLLGGRAEDPIDWERMGAYAYGVGPSLERIAKRDSSGIISTGFVEQARQRGLRVHPYTVRRDSFPSWSTSIDETHQVLMERLKVDGFFTDFPDLSRIAVERLAKP